MQTVLIVMMTLSTAASVTALVCGRRFVRGTTLFAAWCWMLLAVLSVGASSILSVLKIDIGPGWKSAACYLSATLMLTPLVAMLGARRPGWIAWQWFVVLPLIVVLQWPAVTQLVSSGGRERIDLGGPAVIGFLVVLVMAVGTWMPTRNWYAMMLYSMAVLCSLAPAAGWVEIADGFVFASVFLTLFAFLRISSRALVSLDDLRKPKSDSARLNIVWQMFRDLYGFAWSSRVMDRINMFAPRENWTVTLTRDGFKRIDGNEVTDADVAQPAVAFRWVLSRFVNDSW